MSEETTMMRSLQQLAKFADGDDSEVTVESVELSDPPVYSPDEVKEIRSKIPATQRVLAHALAVSTRTVEAWETGRSKPSGSSRRLLEMIDRDPNLFELMQA
jgi:putative transcriptional regulator